MRARRLALWATGLVAAAAFGVAAIFGITAASAGETADPSTDGPVPLTEVWD
jgi:hypothetical protein